MQKVSIIDFDKPFDTRARRKYLSRKKSFIQKNYTKYKIFGCIVAYRNWVAEEPIFRDHLARSNNWTYIFILNYHFKQLFPENELLTNYEECHKGRVPWIDNNLYEYIKETLSSFDNLSFHEKGEMILHMNEEMAEEQDLNKLHIEDMMHQYKYGKYSKTPIKLMLELIQIEEEYDNTLSKN